MSKGAPFAVETRHDIVKSAVNTSPSKTMFSFSKDKRFQQAKPVCPYVSYQNNLSTLSHRKTGFGLGKRRVFSQVSQVPASWTYFPPKEKPDPTSQFALGREKCVANSYYPPHPEQVPGPGRYENQKMESKKKGYSMRPKTANQRTYFIDNKELKLRPSPFYEQGRQIASKFRTVTMGGASLTSKHDRFKDSTQRTPSPFMYQPRKYGINKYSKGGKMGKCTRISFVDQASRSSYTPGPGNYQPTTEFGHYKKHWQSIA